MAEYWPIKSDNSRLNMADLQSLSLFVKYEKLSECSERVVLPCNNPFDEYDDKKFRERFQLSKIAVVKLLEKVIINQHTHTHKSYCQNADPFCK